MKWTTQLVVAVGIGVVLSIGFIPARTQAGDFGSSDSSAEQSSESWPKLGLGVRIGGHGFRHVDDGRLSWDDCRMNGTGLFATLDVSETLFAELSVDSYHATGETMSAGMDRLSLYVLGAIGARFLPDFLISPYLQAGIGPEWTRIEVGDHLERALLVAPFFGLGGEINLGSLKLGAHLRSYAMGLPDHLREGRTHGHTSAGDMRLHYETAAQGQFFVRWVF